MNEQVRRRLESFIAQGRVILFTGSGFSLGAQNHAGSRLPTTAELAKELWKVAFPGDPYEDSDIQDVFEASASQAKTKTAELLTSRLSVDAGSLPDYYTRWFSFPWHRIYTVNIDDLADAVDRTVDLPRRLESVSALSDTLPSTVDGLAVVHLNGALRDVPNVTFGNRQYAERLAQSDAWYALLARELATHPVVFVGTTLDEPPLWQYVEARGRPVPRSRDLRPGGILVSPELKKARAVALRQYRIDWVPGTAEDFAGDVLEQLQPAANEGLALIARTAKQAEETLTDISGLLTGPSGDEREFLRGLEPRWSDITDGFAIERGFDSELTAEIHEKSPKLVVLTGTAGAGKSTCAMRLVLSLQAEGLRCFVINEDGDVRAHHLRRAVLDNGVDVLFIPNLERLGRAAVGTLRDLADSQPDLLVISSVRSPWYRGQGVATYVERRKDAVEGTVPNLTDGDIDGLIEALSAANRLGALQGKTKSQQRQVLADKCDRQLLVAMIEATSGERFEARIEDECRQLGPEDALLYGVAALATNFRINIDNGDLLAAVGGDPAEQMRRVSDLERVHLLVRRKGNVQLRHRVVAEHAVGFFRASRLVESPLRGLVFALAAIAEPGALRRSPAGRGLIRLINHKLLIEFLRLPEPDEADCVGIRGVFEEVEDLLSRDYHYWLQRGSFETEVGNLDLARNFLQQARGLSEDDPFVETQWAYMTLKRASRRAAEPESPAEVDEAFTQLEDQIAGRGRQDSYPFHIFGSQGLAWAKRAPLAPEEKRVLLQRIRAVMDEAKKHHPEDRGLKKLAMDVDTTYFNLAVSDE